MQSGAHPLAGLRTVGLRLKNVVMAVVVLPQLVPQHIEGLHQNQFTLRVHSRIQHGHDRHKDSRIQLCASYEC